MYPALEPGYGRSAFLVFFFLFCAWKLSLCLIIFNLSMYLALEPGYGGSATPTLPQPFLACTVHTQSALTSSHLWLDVTALHSTCLNNSATNQQIQFRQIRIQRGMQERLHSNCKRYLWPHFLFQHNSHQVKKWGHFFVFKGKLQVCFWREFKCLIVWTNNRRTDSLIKSRLNRGSTYSLQQQAGQERPQAPDIRLTSDNCLSGRKGHKSNLMPILF